MLAIVGMIGAVASASAQQAPGGLSPQDCYKEDSECTQFCGEVTGDLRYECFQICDRMLDNCLSTGEWDDSPEEFEPGTGQPPPPPDDRFGELSSLLLQMLMVAADEDKDGRLPPKEIQSLKEKIRGKVNVRDNKKKPKILNQKQQQ